MTCGTFIACVCQMRPKVQKPRNGVWLMNAMATGVSDHRKYLMNIQQMLANDIWRQVMFTLDMFSAQGGGGHGGIAHVL